MIARSLFLAPALALLLGNGMPEHGAGSSGAGDDVQLLVDKRQMEAAFERAREAADAGDPEGHEWLGWFYDRGEGVAEDDGQALYHYRIAIAGGQNYARWRVGVMIDLGEAEGTLEEAVALFQAAAADGHTDAMTSLAVMQATGRGTPQDFPGALANYMQAAQAGNPHGIQGVGVLFALGQGVEQDAIEAAAWFLVAGLAGNETGRANFSNMRGQLGPEELAQVFVRAREVAQPLGVDVSLLDEVQPR